MEVSQTTVWSRGGLTKSPGSPAPKLVGKGVPEPMSPGRGSTWAQWEGSLRRDMALVSLKWASDATSGVRVQLCLPQELQEVFGFVLMAPQCLTQQHRDDSPPLRSEVILSFPKLGRQDPSISNKTKAFTLAKYEKVLSLVVAHGRCLGNI